MIASQFLKNSPRWLFLLTGVCYIFLFAPYGFEGTDTGYIFGNAWNIYNGALPHADFIYTRPAIPAYFHTLFLFVSETHGYFLERIFFYIQVFLYAYLGVKLLLQKLHINNNTHLYLLATLGAMFSIHNYPPMGWNTIDGVFFMVVGLFLLLKDKATWLTAFIGVLFLVAGTFSKQSFYFMPIFLFVYLIFQKDWRRLKWYCGFGVLWVLTYVGIKLGAGTWFGFIEQAFARTDSSALVEAGFKEYYLALKFNFLWVLAIVIIVGLLKRFAPNFIGFSAVVLGVLLFITNHFFNDDTAWSKIPILFQIWFVFGLLYFALLSLKDKKYSIGVLLILLSWSAAISNGYRTPIHFSIPFIVSVYLFFKMEGSKFSNNILVGAVLVSFGVFFFGYQTIYRDSTRSELTYDMGAVFPQLAYIKSDKEAFDKYTELKSLSNKYTNFTVLPSITQAHYLTKTVNPMGVDWPLDVEINDEFEKLERRLIEKEVIVLMEKNEFTEKELKGYLLVSKIENTWKIIDETNYFKVYKYK